MSLNRIRTLLPRITAFFQSDSFRAFIFSVLQMIGQYAIYFVCSPIVVIAEMTDPTSWGNDQALLVLREIGRLVAFTISVFLATRIFQDRDVADLGLKLNRWALYDFLAGLSITFLVIGVSILVYIGSGWIKISSFAWETDTWPSILGNILVCFLIFAFIGWSEELLSRGFHFQTISRGLNVFWGAAISTAIFAYFHRNNPGITFTDILIIYLFGLVMVYAYLRTRQLWLAIGLHTGWDFFVVVVFFGTPIGNLDLFHLVRIAHIKKVGSYRYYLELLSLVMIIGLIFIYTKARIKRAPLIFSDSTLSAKKYQPGGLP